jgi:predicted nucleotidyltransferase
VFALDRQRLLRELAARAEKLTESCPQAAAVWLVGSLARNEAKPGSDADIIVLVHRTDLPFLERSAVFGRAFEGVGIACDVRVYTLTEWDELDREGRRLPRELRRQGLCLATR